MPATFRAGTTVYTGSSSWSTTITRSYTSGSGQDRLLMLHTHGSSDNTAASYAGVGMTSMGSPGSIRLWRRTAPATGANNLVMTVGTYQYTTYSISDWEGVDQANPVGTVTSGTGTGSSASTGTVTCPDGGAILAAVSFGYSMAPGTITAAAGTLISWVRSSGNGFSQANSYRNSTGAISWSRSVSTAYSWHAVPINPSVSFMSNLPKVYSQAIQGSVM